jgi:hypothetical protein
MRIRIVEKNMDPFDRTFLSAANVAGIPMASISRQIPLLRRCVGLDQTVLLLARCGLPDRPLSGDHIMLLTKTRMIVTSESRILHRPRAHLDAAVTTLRNVVWTADPLLTSMELAATAPDGVRERFIVKVRKPGTIWHLEAALGYVFRPATIGLRKLDNVGQLRAAA